MVPEKQRMVADESDFKGIDVVVPVVAVDDDEQVLVLRQVKRAGGTLPLSSTKGQIGVRKSSLRRSIYDPATPGSE